MSTINKDSNERIIIRNAMKDDLRAIFEVEQNSYPFDQQLPSQEFLERRLNIFGIRVAEHNGRIVGFYTCVPASLNWKNHAIDEETIQKIRENRHPNYMPWFEEYHPNKKYNTLFVTSTAVMTQYQGEGIGKALVMHSLELARTDSLEYRASVLRPTKTLTYIALGFTLGQIIEKYSQDLENGDKGIFAFKKV